MNIKLLSKSIFQGDLLDTNEYSQISFIYTAPNHNVSFHASFHRPGLDQLWISCFLEIFVCEHCLHLQSTVWQEVV